MNNDNKGNVPHAMDSRLRKQDNIQSDDCQVSPLKSNYGIVKLKKAWPF